MKSKLFITSLILCLGLFASTTEASTLKISNAWVRATPPNAQVAGAFLSIENTSSKTDRLLSASTNASARVEIHEMKMDGELMQMRQLSDGLPIPVKQTVILKPGGIHLMLIAPKRPFTESQKIIMTLVFEQAGKHQVEFNVLKQAPSDTATNKHHH